MTCAALALTRGGLCPRAGIVAFDDSVDTTVYERPASRSTHAHHHNRKIYSLTRLFERSTGSQNLTRSTATGDPQPRPKNP